MLWCMRGESVMNTLLLDGSDCLTPLDLRAVIPLLVWYILSTDEKPTIIRIELICTICYKQSIITNILPHCASTRFITLTSVQDFLFIAPLAKQFSTKQFSHTLSPLQGQLPTYKLYLSYRRPKDILHLITPGHRSDIISDSSIVL